MQVAGPNSELSFRVSRSGCPHPPMKQLALLLALLAFPLTATFAADPDGRSAFINPPGRDITAALKRAETEKKRVLVFIVDPAKKEGFHIEGTMGSAEAKKLVKDNFLVVIIPSAKEKHVAGLVDDVTPVHPAYVLFKADGTVIAKGDAAMGAANGLKLIQGWVANP